MLITVCFNKSQIWEKSRSWDMAQNALGQSDWGFLNQIYISLEQSDKKARFFECWYKFNEIKSWLKNIGGEHGQKWLFDSVCRTLKLAVSHEKINGVNWFFVCCQNLGKNGPK